MRALELPQKIIFASKAAGVVIKYDQTLVQSLFLYCIETGLRDDVVRVKLRPLLQKSTIVDEELIREVTIEATTESERKAKFLASQKQSNPKATCSRVGSDCENLDKVKVDPKVNGLGDQVTALQAEIASLRKSMGSLSANEVKPRPKVGKPRMCEACLTEKAKRCGIVFDVVVLSTMHVAVMLTPNRQSRETNQVYHHETGRRPISTNRVPPVLWVCKMGVTRII